MKKKSKKDSPLTAKIEGDELVIRIGINTLAFSAEHCPLLYDHGKDEAATKEKPYDKYVKVVDKKDLARDVISAMLREEEDGATPLNSLIDNAIVYACEDGSEAFSFDDDDE